MTSQTVAVTVTIPFATLVLIDEHPSLALAFAFAFTFLCPQIVPLSEGSGQVVVAGVHAVGGTRLADRPATPSVPSLPSSLPSALPASIAQDTSQYTPIPSAPATPSHPETVVHRYGKGQGVGKELAGALEGHTHVVVVARATEAVAVHVAEDGGIGGRLRVGWEGWVGGRKGGG